MNYPYNLLRSGELERYIDDVMKEPESVREEIRQYHYEMGRLCREAAQEIATYDYKALKP